MKPSFLFSILIFLLLILPVGAGEVTNGSISSNVLTDTEVLLSHTTVGASEELNALYIDSGVEVAGLHSITLYMDYARWAGDPEGYVKSDVIYRQGATTVGTGYVYYWAMNTDSNPGYDMVYIKCYFDDGLDVGSGKQVVFIDGDVTSSIATTHRKEALISGMDYDDKFVGMGYCYEPSPLVMDLFTYESDTYIYKSFYNEYNWWYDGLGELLEFNITRDAGNTSMIKVVNSGSIELINETSLQGTSIPVVSDDLDNSTWYFTAEDNNGVTYSRTFDFIADPPMSAEIEFNQSYYTDPEAVGVEYEIISMDTNAYSYWVELLGTNDGSSWVQVNAGYNSLSESSGNVSLDVYPYWLTYPMTIKTTLHAYNKVLGNETILATTSEAMYNPESDSPGTIWTDKSEYNQSEYAIVYYDTDHPNPKITVGSYNQHRDIAVFNVETGNHSMIFQWDHTTLGQHTFLLWEDGTADVATVQVVAGDEPYCRFTEDEAFIGGMGLTWAYNNFYNDTVITLYDGYDLVIYEKTALVGSKHGGIIINDNRPGIWTISMNHSGTLYNDTINVRAPWTYISCDQRVYDADLGDTITIGYTLLNRSQKIVLTDSKDRTVKTWSCYNSDILLKSYGEFTFTLEDGNEYGIDVITELEAGLISSGYWSIEVIEYGAVVEENGEKIGVSAKIEYSPEGYIEYDLMRFADNMGFKGTTGNFIFSLICIIFSIVGIVIAAAPAKIPINGNVIASIAILEFFGFTFIGMVDFLFFVLFVIAVGFMVFFMARREAA